MKESTRSQNAIDDFVLTLKGGACTSLIARAEEAMQGMLVLNGTGPEPVFVGIPPRWEDNPCGVGGYTWTMSRLKYMVTLCKAFLLTGERRYLDKVETDLNNWFDTVPAPPVPYDYESACYYHGVHNWRMLELGYRMVYTFPILRSVLEIHGSNRKLLERIQASIAEHAERISAGSHLLWPGQDHNHYTQEINGLLSAASMLPDDPRSSKWIAQAMDGLEHACACQITEGGSQVEGSAEYHSAVVIDFCCSIHFAGKCGRTFSPQFISRVQKALDFAIHTVSPNGNMLPFGDSDTIAYTPYDAAMLSFLLFGETKHLFTLRQLANADFFLQQLSERFPWGFSRIPDLLQWLKSPLKSENQMLLPLVSYQEETNQYIARSGWNRDAACLYFSSNSPLYPGSNHAHMDQLGIMFGAYGKMLLQDPGRYTYKECADRHLFKSSQVHNVPTINGEDAFAYLGTFAYGSQKDGKLTAIMDSDRIKGAFGYQLNYDPVAITRSAALIDGEIILIADTFENVKGKNIKVFFHLNSTHVRSEDFSVITDDSDANICIHSSLTSQNGKLEILEGRLSDVFYHDYPSRHAVFSSIAREDTATLIFAAVPFNREHQNRLENLVYDGNRISFVYNAVSYQISYNNGIFTF